jgi:hypothetical protein
MFGDPLFTLAIVGGFLALSTQAYALAWPMLMLAFATKPQAWVMAPLALPVSIASGSSRKNLLGLLVALTLGLIVVSPYGTRVGLLIERHLTAIQLFPWLSANAHNLWWLLSWGDGQRSDRDFLLGALTYRQVGLVLLLMAVVWGLAYLWRARKRFGPRSINQAVWPAAAFMAVSFFILPTAMHENYSFAALSLLTIASAVERRIVPLAVVFSVTTAVNVFVHDPAALETAWSHALPLTEISLLNAATNVTVFVLFALLLRSPQLDGRRYAEPVASASSRGALTQS